MKITKFVHSCILVEHNGTSILFDPGIFSWQSGVIDIAQLPNLDAVVVSHKHPDHMGEPFVRALIEKYPEVQWFAPSDAHEDLKTWGAHTVTNQSVGDLVVVEQDHAPVAPVGVPVRNLITHWHDVITHPGDTHDFDAPKDILLLPIQAPWGTTVRAFELVQELRPKYVLPIHDWMWNDEWRERMYDRLGAMLDGTATTFLRPVNGQPIEVDL